MTGISSNPSFFNINANNIGSTQTSNPTTPVQNLDQALSDGKLTSQEFTELKQAFGGSEQDFLAGMESTIGARATALLQQANHAPVEVFFRNVGNDVVQVDNDNDRTNGAGLGFARTQGFNDMVSRMENISPERAANSIINSLNNGRSPENVSALLFSLSPDKITAIMGHIPAENLVQLAGANPDLMAQTLLSIPQNQAAEIIQKMAVLDNELLTQFHNPSPNMSQDDLDALDSSLSNSYNGLSSLISHMGTQNISSSESIINSIPQAQRGRLDSMLEGVIYDDIVNLD